MPSTTKYSGGAIPPVRSRSSSSLSTEASSVKFSFFTFNSHCIQREIDSLHPGNLSSISARPSEQALISLVAFPRTKTCTWSTPVEPVAAEQLD